MRIYHSTNANRKSAGNHQEFNIEIIIVGIMYRITAFLVLLSSSLVYVINVIIIIMITNLVYYYPLLYTIRNYHNYLSQLPIYDFPLFFSFLLQYNGQIPLSLLCNFYVKAIVYIPPLYIPPVILQLFNVFSVFS